MLVREGHKDAAIAAYRQFLKENPFAEERTDVFIALAELGVQPEAHTANAPAVSTPAKSSAAASSAATGTNVAPDASAVSAAPAAAGTSATSAAQSPQSASQPKK
jgi:hypothetical protein